MKRRLFLLVLLPLVSRADPHFGPNFELYLGLAALWYFVELSLLIAQLIGWEFRLLKRQKVNVGAARITAVLASWLGAVLIFNGSIGAPGNGLLSPEGGMYLAAFAGLGSTLAVFIANKL